MSGGQHCHVSGDGNYHVLISFKWTVCCRWLLKMLYLLAVTVLSHICSAMTYSLPCDLLYVKSVALTCNQYLADLQVIILSQTHTNYSTICGYVYTSTPCKLCHLWLRNTTLLHQVTCGLLCYIQHLLPCTPSTMWCTIYYTINNNLHYLTHQVQYAVHLLIP